MDFDWYKIVPNNEPVTQGDIIINCPYIKLEPTTEHPYVEPVHYDINAIVMTQACDLEHGKVKEITFCILEPFNKVLKQFMVSQKLAYNALGDQEKKVKQDIINKFLNGQILKHHIINKFESPHLKMDFQSVLIKQTFTLPAKSVNLLLQSREGDRLRLLPPYREHLGQAFARNFMRIGLPIDIKIGVDEV